MRPSITALAGLLLSATLVGCSGSATIPQPPAQVTNAAPPGMPPESFRAKKATSNTGVMAPVNPYK